MSTITTCNVSRGGGPKSRLSSGGATSAATLRRRVGFDDRSGLVVVEGGKRITYTELSRSVNEAATRWLNQHGVRTEGLCR